jgi:putative hemolysin
MSKVEDDKDADSENQIFRNALDFSGVKARDEITPRTEIAVIDVMQLIESFLALFLETEYSKMVMHLNSL